MLTATVNTVITSLDDMPTVEIRDGDKVVDSFGVRPHEATSSVRGPGRGYPAVTFLDDIGGGLKRHVPVGTLNPQQVHEMLRDSGYRPAHIYRHDDGDKTPVEVIWV